MIAITGATGQLGQLVIEQLLKPFRPASWSPLCVTRPRPTR